MNRQPVFEYHAETVQVPLSLPGGNTKSITIESGYAFGTGSHFTTRLCLKMIEQIYEERILKNVLDVGCGSAILAISTIALGAKNALAVDIEPTVIGEARKNVDKNGYSAQITVQNTKINDIEDRFDLVLANILTDQILKIADDLVSRVNVKGYLILSGIRINEKEVIIDKLTKLNTEFKKILTDDDWCSLLFSKF
ncbi:MAG TPA: 50S ribosomal protein L11 methyltransferase [Thermodesulfobacteriota bacterium]|nr:50S ribosomal protein L11 methyltransferase [Thermodesulfobacteriota bacterium]